MICVYLCATKVFILMLKTQILAAEVSNLTDARYFAAWGVDYISFNCNQGEENYIAETALAEIKDWIEGPKFLAYFNGLDEAHKMEQFVDQMALQGMVLGPFAPENTIKSLDAEMLFKEFVEADAEKIMTEHFETEYEHQSLLQIVKTNRTKASNFFLKKVLLDIEDLDLETVQKVLNESQCGLVLRGGQEEKVGLKSFDFLDEVFEMLID